MLLGRPSFESPCTVERLFRIVVVTGDDIRLVVLVLVEDSTRPMRQGTTANMTTSTLRQDDTGSQKLSWPVVVYCVIGRRELLRLEGR